MPGTRTCIFKVQSYSKKASGSGGNAQVAYDHNSGIERGENADPTLSGLNVNYTDLTQGMRVEEYIDQQLYKLREMGVEMKKIRKDARGTIEVILRANNVLLKNGIPPADFDMDGWAKTSYEFVDEMFNPPNHEIHFKGLDGKQKTEKIQNIYHAALHLDESNPHIHFLIMPIDEHGHLNSKHYIGYDKFKTYQTQYYEAAKEYGLDRGVKGTPGRAKSIQQYHAYIEDVMAQKAPEIKPGETIEEYKERADDTVRSCHAHMADQDRTHEREMKQLRGRETTYHREVGKLHAEINEALDLGPGNKIDLDRIRTVAHDAEEYRKLKKAIDNYPDYELTDQLQDNINELLRWQTERELEEIDLKKEHVQEHDPVID